MRNVIWLAIFALCLAGDMPVATAALAPDTGAPSAANAPGKIAVAPHRAIYDMKLASVKNGSNIASISGHLLFEWADVCDGWAVQQHLKLHFNYAEGDESDVTSTEVTWESKDGKRYNFNVRRLTDGKETENYRGKAQMNDKDGTVTYTEPSGKTVTLPAEALFPSAHTQAILRKAEAGEKLFSRRVFDGSDEDGSEDVSAFIDQPQAHKLDADLKAKLKNSPLVDQIAWPVHMAFFKLDTETGAPDYEMDLHIQPNGVVRKMVIDNGDFSVMGTLSAIEPLPQPHCAP